MVDVSQGVVSTASHFARMDVLLDDYQVGDDHLDLAGAHVHSVDRQLIDYALKEVPRLDDVLLDAFQSQRRSFVQRIAFVSHEPLVVVRPDLVDFLHVVTILTVAYMFFWNSPTTRFRYIAGTAMIALQKPDIRLYQFTASSISLKMSLMRFT